MKDFDILRSKLILIPLFLASIVASVYLLQIMFSFLSQFGWIFITIIYAYILYVLIAPLNRLIQRLNIPSSISLIISFLIVIAIITLTIVFINPVLAQELKSLSEQIKRNDFGTSFDNIIDSVSKLLNTDPTNLKTSILDNLRNYTESFANNFINIISNAFFTIFQIVLALILGYFFIREGGSWFNSAMKIIPKKYKGETKILLEYFHRSASSFLQVQILMAFLYSIINFIVMSALGINFALTASIVAFITFIIPGIGPVLAVLVPLGVTFLFDGSKVLPLIVILLIVQQIILNILVPRLYGNKVGVHPIIILFLILIGIQLFGVLGVLIFIPLATVLINVGVIYFARIAREEN